MSVEEDVLQEVVEDLIDLLESEGDTRARFAAALQLAGMGEGERTVDGLVRMLDGPSRIRAARQLGRLGPAAGRAWPALVRAVVQVEDDALCVAAVEALVAIDPDNLFGAVQLVRLLQVLRYRPGRDGVEIRARALKAIGTVGRLLPAARKEVERAVEDPQLRSLARSVLGALEPMSV